MKTRSVIEHVRKMAVASLAFSLVVISSCGGSQPVASQFPEGWLMGCTDMVGDVRQMSNMGTAPDNALLSDAADITNVVLELQDSDGDGNEDSLVFVIRLNAHEGEHEDSYVNGGMPGLIKARGGMNTSDSPTWSATQSAAITFTPRSGQKDSVILEIELQDEGPYGHVDLFEGGKISEFEATFKNGEFSGKVPLSKISVTSDDDVRVDTFSSWNMTGFVFSDTDSTESCKQVVNKKSN